MTLNSSLEEPAALASRFINQTSKNIFLTGKAGTGKTTFLRHIVKHTHKKTLIVAPTGIAAINAGGMTIHSLFQLPFGCFIPQNNSGITHNSIKINDPLSLIRTSHMSGQRRHLLKEVELLIIDEVSMLRADILDAIDTVFRHVRRKNHLPFGGAQVLFIGDLLQLPPVVKEEEWSFLKSFYKSIYFFDAQVLQREKPVYIELDKIYRQGDQRFISLLNNLRNNEITKEDTALLSSYYKPQFKPQANDNYIMLTTHNYKAAQLNTRFLNALEERSYFFDAIVKGEFSEYAYPLEKTLELKKGAQVMFVKNDPTGAQRFFNGKIGVVSFLSEQKIEVRFSDTGKTVSLEHNEWQNQKYELNPASNEIEEVVMGTFTQYPVKLAWAITVHKSQGLTFDKAIVDIGDAFAPGQVYVALSRLRSLEGVVLTSLLNDNALFQDKKVISFSNIKKEQENLDTLVKKESVVFLKNYLFTCFEFDSLVGKLYEHAQSYTKDENRSAKQKHQGWAQQVQEEFNKTKEFGDKFLQQLKEMFDKAAPAYLGLVDKRTHAAKEYFVPVFKKISKDILQHIEAVKSEQNVTTYLKELLELEMLFYEQFKLINKASALSSALLSNTPLTREAAYNLDKDPVRAELINQISRMPAEEKKEKKERAVRKPRVKKETSKKDKPDTKNASLELFKAGKTIGEIAVLRGVTINTIEIHLAHYVAKGIVKAELFMTSEKLEGVLAVVKKLNTFSVTPIKNALGDSYTYGEIKMGLAHYLSREDI